MSVLKKPVSKNPSRGVETSGTKALSIVLKISSDVPKLWEEGFRLVWDNPVASPSEMVEYFGTDAKEIFELSESMFAFIQTILQGTMEDRLAHYQALLSLRRPYTVHEDGTITID